MSVNILPLQIIGTEWLWVIFVVIVLLFGSKKVPELARALGRAMAEFQKGRMEFERELRLTQEQLMELPRAISEPVDLSVSPSPSTTIRVQPTQPAQVVEQPKQAENVEKEPVEKEINDSQKLLEIAQRLGISTDGKTNEQLKEEIKKALENLE